MNNLEFYVHQETETTLKLEVKKGAITLWISEEHPTVTEAFDEFLLITKQGEYVNFSPANITTSMNIVHKQLEFLKNLNHYINLSDTEKQIESSKSTLSLQDIQEVIVEENIKLHGIDISIMGED